MASLSVSVAMATFNGGSYLGQQLADLATQSVLPAELIVCDDGSSDSTLAILERFAAGAAFPVRIHRNPERLGYRANFLKCASLCRSDLIAFCDQDDRWLPEKIETMLGCFDDADVLLAFHGAEIVADDERRLGRFTTAPRRGGRSPPLTGSPWTSALGFTQMFRRWLCDCDRWWSLSLDHNSDHEPMAHDQWYFFLASTLGTIVNVGAALALYRQHDANVFGWSRAKRSWSARLLARFQSTSWSCERRAHAATQCAIILDHAAAALPSPYDRRASEGATAYRHLAGLCAQRAAIYSERTVLQRTRAFAALARAHGYGADPRRFGAGALIIDLVTGLSGLSRSNRLRSASIDADASATAS